MFEEYSTEHGVHAQSFLGALAAITGDVLLRTTEDLSSVKEKLILSDKVNDLILNEDSDILDVSTILNDFAGDVEAKPKSEEEILAIFERTVENFGGESYPPLSIPKTIIRWSGLLMRLFVIVMTSNVFWVKLKTKKLITGFIVCRL